jgi:N-acylneuraminate cytidylyltransferase
VKIVAVIHAKGESDRLPNKNLKELGGIPLIAHSIINARNTIAHRVIIDSEDSEILEVGESFGAEPLERPLYLARNEITGDDLAYWQAQNFPDSDIIVQVVPTSPFITPYTINKCIVHVWRGYNSSFTVSLERFYTWSHHVEGGECLPDYYDRMGRLKNSNELDNVIVENTGVYAFRTKFALKQHRRIDFCSYKMVQLCDQTERVDINYLGDFKFAEVIWKGLHSSGINIGGKEDLLRAMDRASMT